MREVKKKQDQPVDRRVFLRMSPYLHRLYIKCHILYSPKFWRLYNSDKFELNFKGELKKKRPKELI